MSESFLEKLRRIEEIASREEIETQIIKAKTPEGREIRFDMEKEREKWQEFYEKHNLKTDIPEIKLKEEQIKEIQNLIEKGYVDELAIIADELSYSDVEREMTQGYEETRTGGNFDADGGFATLDQQETPSASSGQAKKRFHLVFYKKVKELDQDPFLKQTLNKSPEDIDALFKQLEQEQNIKLQGLSGKDYLVIQRKFVEETETSKDIQDKDRHMDANRWTWCLRSVFPGGHVLGATWHPADRQVELRSGSPDNRDSGRGARSSAILEI